MVPSLVTVSFRSSAAAPGLQRLIIAERAILKPRTCDAPLSVSVPSLVTVPPSMVAEASVSAAAGHLMPIGNVDIDVERTA